MVNPNNIFEISTENQFNQLALEIFDFQKKNIPIYREYLSKLGKPQPKHYTEIPFLPIDFFKTHTICRDVKIVEEIFKSSGTTGQIRSQHFVEDVTIYRKSFHASYFQFIGNPEEQVILALLPNYIDQGDSSLVFMVNELIAASNNELSAFLLNEPKEIAKRYLEALRTNKKVVLFGVSYALLDVASEGADLSQATIIETGGMKGRRKEMSKEELHQELKSGLNVPFISSEYGMTELLSQGYSNKDGLFETPAWMKILIRDINDPFSYIESGKTGGINVIDLVNINSCSFIATQDLGKIENGLFRIMGRYNNSDIRGCNLLVS
jgi:phenylacetate-coenzyme A ligase PaaK-like adenylate-forming protein